MDTFAKLMYFSRQLYTYMLVVLENKVIPIIAIDSNTKI